MVQTYAPPLTLFAARQPNQTICVRKLGWALSSHSELLPDQPLHRCLVRPGLLAVTTFRTTVVVLLAGSGGIGSGGGGGVSRVSVGGPADLLERRDEQRLHDPPVNTGARRRLWSTTGRTSAHPAAAGERRSATPADRCPRRPGVPPAVRRGEVVAPVACARQGLSYQIGSGMLRCRSWGGRETSSPPAWAGYRKRRCHSWRGPRGCRRTRAPWGDAVLGGVVIAAAPEDAGSLPERAGPVLRVLVCPSRMPPRWRSHPSPAQQVETSLPDAACRVFARFW